MTWVLPTILISLTTVASASPAQISYRTFQYVCPSGQTVRVSYANWGANGPHFALLSWKGQQYALAEALSASGARYAGLNGPAEARGGLEWWEHQGQATLSTFMNGTTTQTKSLLTDCRVRR